MKIKRQEHSPKCNVMLRYDFRDSLLATLVDSVRGAGNRDVHVEMGGTCPERRWGPLSAPVDQEVESLHLKLLAARLPSLPLSEAVMRFNANVPYSGLLHPVSHDVSKA